MATEQERLVTTFFHLSRSAGKQKPNPGVDKIVEAMRVRAQAEAKATNPVHS